MTAHSGKVVCVSGIDTDIGKTVAVGAIARYLHRLGYSVITQKIAQTGCSGVSEDILVHRKMMGIGAVLEDMQGLTCSYVFTQPCSPHLAARIDGRKIDPERIKAATEELQKRYDFVILEGAGGLMVPLLADLLYADYLESKDYFHILVSSPRLGSINHTLLSLEAMKARKLDVRAIVYNRFTDENNDIAADSKEIFSDYMVKNGYPDTIVDLKKCDEEGEYDPDFSFLLRVEG